MRFAINQNSGPYRNQPIRQRLSNSGTQTLLDQLYNFVDPSEIIIRDIQHQLEYELYDCKSQIISQKTLIDSLMKKISILKSHQGK